MPEMTSAEAVRRKLQEFEERIDGAIVAAETIARVRAEAESLQGEIKAISLEWKQALLEAMTAAQQFQQGQRDFERVRAETQATQAELEAIRSHVANDRVSALQSIAEKLGEAKECLQKANQESLSEQAELLKRLDESTRANADSAGRAASLADGRARQLEELLGTIRGETEARLSSAEKLIRSQFETLRAQTAETVRSNTERLHAEINRATRALTETAAEQEALIHQKIDSFKADTTRSLSEQRQATDRQITEFLNKQNTLVQNLSQQIDSYHGVANASSAELALLKTQFGQLTSDLGAVVRKLDLQDDKVRALSQQIKDILDKLAKKSWLPWGK